MAKTNSSYQSLAADYTAAELPDEIQLVARTAVGDEAAFTAIFDHYRQRLYFSRSGLCWRRTR